MITLFKLTPYTDAAVEPSPNHGARKSTAIEGIVLHATADEGNEAGTLTWLRSPKSRVSCHLLVSRGGNVTRLVGDHQRAWHAGAAWWRGTSDVNSITLGIEIANRNDGEPYTDAQYQRVAEIVAHYCRQGLSLGDVVGHADIAQERRTDPCGWDWERFRAMVQHRLRSPDDIEWKRWYLYDRRSADRIAAEQVTASGTLAIGAVVRTPRVSGASGQHRTSMPTPRPRPAIASSGKSFFASRTIWLNGLTVLAAGSVLVGQTLDLAFSVGLDLPQEITMWGLFGVGMVNILLRLETSCPIGRDC